jgi:hypothetical protein
VSAPLVPIPTDKAECLIGKLVHVRWAKAGCCWRLLSISNGEAHLETPKTGRKLVVPIADLCYTRRDEPRETEPAGIYQRQLTVFP